MLVSVVTFGVDSDLVVLAVWWLHASGKWFCWQELYNYSADFYWQSPLVMLGKRGSYWKCNWRHMSWLSMWRDNKTRPGGFLCSVGTGYCDFHESSKATIMCERDFPSFVLVFIDQGGSNKTSSLSFNKTILFIANTPYWKYTQRTVPTNTQSLMCFNSYTSTLIVGSIGF